MTIYETIPAEMKSCNQWICWQYQCRGCWTVYDGKRGDCPECDGDVTKVPVDPSTGQNAKSNDSATWGSFDDARDYHESSDDTQGIGFMFDSEGTIVGVDLDDVRDPDTGEPTDEAKEIVNSLDSWTEVSPSGTGYHVFVHGFVPDGGKRGDIDNVSHLEMYDETRFFTVTGEHVSGTPEGIKNRVNTLREIHREYVADEPEESNSGQSEPSEPIDVSLEDSELLEKAKSADNGDEFRRLWNGDTSMHSSDHSRADLALCGHLAFWTGGDRQRMDSLFRRSGLMRDKWDENRGSQTYGERTIDKALKGRTDFYDPNGRSDTTDTVSPTTADSTSRNTALPWSTIQQWYADSETAKTEARYQAVIKLLEEYDFATLRDTQEVYVYHEPSGVFERGGVREIEHELQSGLGRHYSQHEKREIIGHIKARTYADRDELDADGFDEPLICVANGVLNVETREFYDHDPEYLFTRSIPWKYDPEAGCPNLESFMGDITQREADKLTMYEMVGHALHPEYIRKKFMILFGPGDNGKTVFYKFVRKLLGGLENISAVSLQKIADNRFASETILGKFANIAPDMDAKKVSDLGDLKTLTGGDDPYFFEPKGKQGYEAVNTSTMMFGCNEPPVLPERGKKIETRIVPIELPYEFVDGPDPNNPLEKQRVPSEDLTSEVVTEREMSGFLNMALDGLDRLLETHDVSLPESPAERLELYEQHSDPIKQFAIKCLDTDSGSVIRYDDVYNTYIEFCRQNDVKNVSRSVFFKKLRQTTFPVSVTQPREHGQDRCLSNAAFTEFAEQYTGDVLLESSETDGEQQTSTRNDPVSIHDAATDPTGYPTVQGEVKTIDYPEGDDSPALKGTLVDGNTAIDVVSWDDGSCLEHGEEIIIENADTSTFNGATQLIIKNGVTSIHPAPENGQTQIDDPKPKVADGGDSDLESSDGDVSDTPADRDDTDSDPDTGGESDDDTDSLEGGPLNAPIVHYVRENQQGRDGVPKEELVEYLSGRGAAEKQIEHWIAELHGDELSEPVDGVFRV